MYKGNPNEKALHLTEQHAVLQQFDICSDEKTGTELLILDPSKL